jgi:EpsD family peptidyl-prolyl cis-trans isomerase
MQKAVKFSASVLAATALLAACQGKNPESSWLSRDAVKINGQVVKGGEFAPRPTAMVQKNAPPVSEAAMKNLVNMELLRQAAVADHLDQEPLMKARLANIQRSLLATAYMDKVMAESIKATPEEIKAFYDQNKAAYADRKHMELRQIVLQPPPGKDAEYRDQVSRSKSPAEFEKWLNDHHVKHESLPLSVYTDQMAADMVKTFEALPVGGSAVIADNGRMNVVYLLGVQPAPIDFEEASKRIGDILVARKRISLVDDTANKLREKAKIEYVAPYSAQGLAPAGDTH